MPTQSYDRIGIFERIHKNIHKPIFEPPVDQEIQEKFVWHIKKYTPSINENIKPTRAEFFNRLSQQKINQINTSINSKFKGKASPEVMIKIDRQSVSSGGGSAKHTINYAQYIGRDGKVEVFTSDGLIIDNEEDLKEYVEAFTEDQEDMKPLRSENERISVNMILSMNYENVDSREDFREATEEFIKEQVLDKGFDCFWAFHDEEKIEIEGNIQSTDYNKEKGFMKIQISHTDQYGDKPKKTTLFIEDKEQIAYLQSLDINVYTAGDTDLNDGSDRNRLIKVSGYKNPHAHLTVGYRSVEGKRFDHNIKQLNEMRENFAENLNKRGIEATATPRWIRGEVSKAISQDKYHKILNEGLHFKDFDKSAEEYINFTFEQNKKTKEYRFMTSPNKSADQEYFKKRNDCLAEFSRQLANEAKKSGNDKIAHELYTYSKLIKQQTFDNQEKIKDTALHKVEEQRDLKKYYQYKFDVNPQKLKRFRFAKENFVASFKSEKGGIQGFNDTSKKRFINEFHKSLTKHDKDSTVLVFDIEPIKNKEKFLNQILKNPNIMENSFATIDKIKDNKNKERVFIASKKKLSNKEVALIVKHINKEIDKYVSSRFIRKGKEK